MKEIITAVCIAVLTAVQTVFCMTARAAEADIIEELFALNMSGRVVAGFYDDLKPGQADWTAVCRVRLYGRETSDSFIESAKSAADELINAEGFVTPTELQRTAILLAAFGECSRSLINAAAYENPNLDRQGLNAWIWALAAANCSGLEADNGAVYTRLLLADGIIEKQLPDGGFSLRGSSADADITASAIYALAPLRDNESVREALDKAVFALSSLQTDSGGFLSLGSETSESTSQAIIAFTSVGIVDERLDKAVSALLSFRRGDGGFAHSPDGKTDKMSTSQAIQAFTSLKLSEQGERLFDVPKNPPVTGSGSISGSNEISENDPKNDDNSQKSDDISHSQDYTSGNKPPENDQNTSENTQNGEESNFPEFGSSNKNSQNSQNITELELPSGLTSFHIKLTASSALAAIGITVLIVAVVKRKKGSAAVGTVLVILSAAVWLLNIKTSAEYNAQPPENGITVRVGADCTKALDHLSDIDESINPLSVIPENGIILPLDEITLSENSTAFDALTEAARSNGVPVDFMGASNYVYVRGIGFVYEFGFGSESGWTYRVNGSAPPISAGAYKLSDGDTVEFIYTCELGENNE